MKAAETIAPKKTISLTIGYKQPGAGDKPEKDKGAQVPNLKGNLNPSKVGKLIITNPNTNIAWMYYLKYSV